MTVVSVRYIQEGFYARFGIYSWEFPAGTSFSMVRSHLISGGLLPREAEARVSGCGLNPKHVTNPFYVPPPGSILEFFRL